MKYKVKKLKVKKVVHEQKIVASEGGARKEVTAF